MENEVRLRTGINQFVQRATPQEVALEFRRKMDRGVRVPILAEGPVNSNYFDIAPPWLNPSGYLEELHSFGEADFWDSLLKHQAELYDELWQLTRTLYHHTNSPDFKTPGHAIEGGNLTFFSNAIVMIGMTALFGDRFESVMSGRPQYRTHYRAVLTIAEGFGTPTNSPDELISRLQALFPLKGSQEEGAFEVLSKTGAFVDDNKQCPAQEMTKVIFETYGELLRDRKYLRKLKRRITTSPIS